MCTLSNVCIYLLFHKQNMFIIIIIIIIVGNRYGFLAKDSKELKKGQNYEPKIKEIIEIIEERQLKWFERFKSTII